MSKKWYLTDNEGLKNIIDVFAAKMGRKLNAEEKKQILTVIKESQRDLKELNGFYFDCFETYLHDNGYEIKKKAWWRF